MTILLASTIAILLLILAVAAALALFAANTARRVEALLPAEGRFMDVAGARIHYVEEGAGRQAVVLIHGLGGQLRHFTHSLTGRLRGGARIVAIDRPGAGHSTRHRAANARLMAQAEAVAVVIRALGLRRPLLVGHSLGGALSLAIALAYPDLVGGLALVAPLTQVVEEPPEAFRKLAIASPFARRLVAWTLAVPMSIRNSRALLAAVFTPEPVPPDFATNGGGLLSLRPVAFYETSSDMVAVNDDLREMVPRYPTLRVPVGILYGRGDNILDPDVHGRRLAEAIPGATFELVDGGHMLPVTQPDRVAAFVREVAARLR